jgi:hypothetical protein
LTADPWVEELREQLRAVGDGERAVGAKAYLKSDLEFLSDRIDEVSGLTVRVGSTYLPEEQRDELRHRFRDR